MKEYYGIHLVVPGSCNATCPFCYTKDYLSLDKLKFKNNLLSNLDFTLSNIPFNSDVHILFTGKENTTDLLYLSELMDLLKVYNIKEKISGHITFPTNGYDILNAIPLIKDVVNRVGISINSINEEERKKIYNICLTDNDYKVINRQLEESNLLVAASIVYHDIPNLNSILNYIDYALYIGFKHIRLRIDSFATFTQNDINSIKEIFNKVSDAYFINEVNNDSTYTLTYKLNNLRIDFIYKKSVINKNEFMIFDDGVYKDFLKNEKIK